MNSVIINAKKEAATRWPMLTESSTRLFVEGADWQNEQNTRKTTAILESLKKLRGIEVWIGDSKMKELFQNNLYNVIEKLENEQ